MALSTKNQTRKFTVKADVLKRKVERVHHTLKIKTLKNHAEKKLESSFRKLKSFNIKPRIRRVIRQLRRITSTNNIKKVCSNRDTRIRSGAAVGTAVLFSIFTGSVVVGVAQAAVSSAVSSAIAEASLEKRRTSMTGVIEEAKKKNRHQSLPTISSSIHAQTKHDH